MVIREKTRSTFADYQALPETNQIVELIDGEIVASPPLDIHQVVVGAIYAMLHSLRLGGSLRLAPTGLRVDDYNSFEPDMFWVRAESSDCVLEPDGRYWRGAPDLVIEVLSPSTAYRDRGIKFDTYQQSGVREYWLVDGEGRYAEIYALVDGKFERQGLFTAEQSFVSAALGGAEIRIDSWFGG
ncbi:MAG: Uma2 family endonuclease [Anaerolineae bacterium]|nr:Uma2 family endonuclease [Anaerolineae bacterium]